jgi:hypothetical protein
MPRLPHPLALLLLTACGGGGGSGPVAPLNTPLRLEADALDFAPAATTADLTVRLAGEPAQAPVVLQVAVELPPAMTLASGAKLTPARQLATLDGDIVDGRFLIVCGDAENVVAAPLGKGPLFRLRLATSTPRQPGTFAIRLVGLRASAAGGDVVTSETQPLSIPVTIR